MTFHVRGQPTPPPRPVAAREKARLTVITLAGQKLERMANRVRRYDPELAERLDDVADYCWREKTANRDGPDFSQVWATEYRTGRKS